MTKNDSDQYDLFNDLSRNLAAPALHLELMGTAEILRQIERVTGRFARAAVEAAVARQKEITPELLRILEDTVLRAGDIDAGGDYMAHLYTMFLLAQFRESRAYPHLVQFCSLPGDLLHSLCGDFITESLGSVLASVCGGDLGGIQSIIANEHADEWVRGAGLDGLVTLVAEGQTDRETIVAYFAQLFRTKLLRQPSEVWSSLVASACDLYPEELLDDIKQAYREHLVDTFSIGMRDVMHDLLMGKNRVLARLAGNRHHRFVRNTIDEMEWWDCFREGRDSYVLEL